MAGVGGMRSTELQARSMELRAIEDLDRCCDEHEVWVALDALLHAWFPLLSQIEVRYSSYPGSAVRLFATSSSPFTPHVLATTAVDDDAFVAPLSSSSRAWLTLGEDDTDLVVDSTLDRDLVQLAFEQALLVHTTRRSQRLGRERVLLYSDALSRLAHSVGQEIATLTMINATVLDSERRGHQSLSRSEVDEYQQVISDSARAAQQELTQIGLTAHDGPRLAEQDTVVSLDLPTLFENAVESAPIAVEFPTDKRPRVCLPVSTAERIARSLIRTMSNGSRERLLLRVSPHVDGWALTFAVSASPLATDPARWTELRVPELDHVALLCNAVNTQTWIEGGEDEAFWLGMSLPAA
jgi:hypothetical protein